MSSVSSVFGWSLPDAQSRITKKPFGIFITPTTSPVQPERFRGYHTGTDFETFPAEQDQDVSVSAVCSGKVLFRGWVSGYGGLLIQSCTYEGEPVTVLYGHVKNDSITVKKGEPLSMGQSFAVLGKGYSTETDGERKHLHLAVHRGSAIDYKGYVQTADALKQWVNVYP